MLFFLPLLLTSPLLVAPGVQGLHVEVAQVNWKYNVQELYKYNLGENYKYNLAENYKYNLAEN